MPKLAFGVPWSSPFCWTGWAEHLPNLQRPAGYDVRFFRGKGWCPARRHIDLCEQALAWGADLICVIGADQIHPEDLLPRLVQRFEEGCEVVAALVPARGYVGWQDMKPFQPMAWRFKSSNGHDPRQVSSRAYRGMGLDGDMIDVIDPEAGDLQQVHFIGSGVLMFHRDHLLALKKPWFMETIDRESYQRLANMDCTFVWRLQVEAQAKVWVDTTIKVRHLHAFEIDETYQERFTDWMRPGTGSPDICRYDRPTLVTNGKYGDRQAAHRAS
jgi:hypothetical protein